MFDRTAGAVDELGDLMHFLANKANNNPDELFEVLSPTASNNQLTLIGWVEALVHTYGYCDVEKAKDLFVQLQRHLGHPSHQTLSRRSFVDMWGKHPDLKALVVPLQESEGE